MLEQCLSLSNSPQPSGVRFFYDHLKNKKLINKSDVNNPVTMLNLHHYSYNITSQNGEDGIIEHLLALIGETDQKWCVEVGAWDGIFLSNTYNLWHNKEYQAVLIEADTARFTELVTNVQEKPLVHPVQAFVGYDKDNCLDTILSRTNIPINFDVLSIDVDGDDYYIWEAMHKYIPRIVIIEANSSFLYDVERIGGSEDTPTGSSVLALTKLGKKKGYELIAHTGNCIFVHREFYNKIGVIDNSLEKIFNPSWLTPKNKIKHYFKYMMKLI